MKFRTWLEEQSLQLPPIPGNFVGREAAKVAATAILDKAELTKKMSALDAEKLKSLGRAVFVYPRRKVVVVDGFKRFKLT